MPRTLDVLACALVPLGSAASPLRQDGFTAAQWTALRRVFATGICDYRRPGRFAGPPTGTWFDLSDSSRPRPLGPASAIGSRRGKGEA
jgi:hypothetical protein